MNLEKAKRVATSCLAMTSCGFLLWVSQNQVNADTIGTSQQAVVEQSDVTTTTKNQVATVTEQQSQPSYNQSDNGNYANLDSANLDTNGRLIVSGAIFPLPLHPGSPLTFFIKYVRHPIVAGIYP